MSNKPRLRSSNRAKSTKSLESRVSYLEGARTAGQWVITIFVTLVGLLVGTAIYQSFQTSIERNVESQVSERVEEQTTKVAAAVATSEDVSKQVSLIGTDIAAKINPTSTPAPSSDAAEATIIEYFDLLNSGQYGKAWTLLTSGFKYRSGNDDYSEYEAYWKTIEQVKIIEIALIDREDNSTSFIVRLEWSKSGVNSWETSYIYTMIFDEDLGVWLLDIAEST